MIGLTAMAVTAALLVSAAACAQGRGKPLPEPAALPPSAEMPDPLRMMDGRAVSTPAMWRRERRPELRRLFQHYMYGAVPARPRRVEARIILEDAAWMEGRATLRVVDLMMGGTGPVHLLFIVPNQRARPAPAFVGLSFSGIHMATSHPGVPVSTVWHYPGGGIVNGQPTEQTRGVHAWAWNTDLAIERGYAVALFYNGDVVVDRAELDPPGKRGPGDAGAIMRWAWAMQRVVDYLETRPEVDSKRIATVGHSRNGKTALLAAAFDERIAMAISHQSGCGGAAPSRGVVGESVAQITRAFPHWFAPRFTEFAAAPERLPFDQNGLIALMAPRPVLLTCAVEDTWANPHGQFDALRAAAGPYRLMGAEGLAADAFPPIGHLIESRLGFWIRPGIHSMERQDWETYLRFADRHLKAP